MNYDKKANTVFQDNPDLHLQHLYAFRRKVNAKYSGKTLHDLNEAINAKIKEVEQTIEKNRLLNGYGNK